MNVLSAGHERGDVSAAHIPSTFVDLDGACAAVALAFGDALTTDRRFVLLRTLIVGRVINVFDGFCLSTATNEAVYEILESRGCVLIDRERKLCWGCSYDDGFRFIITQGI